MTITFAATPTHFYKTATDVIPLGSAGQTTTESKTLRQAHRGLTDVVADADPSTGAAVYDTTNYYGQSGWFQVGGTSLASALIASVYALAGNPSRVTYPASILYSNQASSDDVAMRLGCQLQLDHVCRGTRV